MNDEKRFTISQAHQEFAKSTYNSIWGLLEKEDRSQEEDQEMLLAAYASLYHWTKVGTAVHHQRGAWMISRDHQSLGEVEPSLARAYALAGDQEIALHHWQQAASLGKRIKDKEDQKIFEGDFQGGNWYQLQTD